MLLPSAFYPHAECLAKYLPHLRPSQVRGLALSDHKEKGGRARRLRTGGAGPLRDR